MTEGRALLGLVGLCLTLACGEVDPEECWRLDVGECKDNPRTCIVERVLTGNVASGLTVAFRSLVSTTTQFNGSKNPAVDVH